MYILNNSSENKYNWSENYFHNDDINLNFIFLKNVFKVDKSQLDNNNICSLYEIIKFKKKTASLKKTFDIDYVILNRVFSYKNNFNKNKYIDFNEELFLTNNNNMLTKNIDFKRKLKFFIKTNRKILKSFFSIKYYRNFSISKNIKKICNASKSDFVFNLENNLTSILMKTDFFFSKKDCIWFINEGFISLNGFVTRKPNSLVKVNDVISVLNSSFYFNFYKNNFDYILNNIYKVNLKLWSINSNRFKNVENKDFKENYPAWIENYKYFKKDIPLNLEVDYISMTIIMFNYELNNNILDFYNYKFVSLFMNRSYNWKFII